MALNLQKIMVTINSSLMITLFISMFFFQLTKSTNTLTKNSKLSALGISFKKKLTMTSKKKTFFIIMLKVLATLSFIPLLLSVILKSPDIIIILSKWFSLNSFSLNMELHYDIKFNLFFFTALTVSSSMMEFSKYYMSKDPKKKAFFHLLMMFLLNMIILTFSNNLFLLFIGWEGVGFLSFLLMSWWYTRTKAKKASLQAVMYNRMGDMGLLLFFSLTLTSLKSWSMSEISSFNKGSFPKMNLMLMGALMAAAGKSAQFGLHPWLPAAMEGPTPVSALLHSSTMVVAGMFLLVRISPIYSKFPLFNSWCLMLGSMTALFAATTAISQHDMKKMVAYSTTSQLGLMMVAMGLKIPLIALFHMCTHAFFKAMLFLSSGSIMHSLKDEQDLRKMGGLYLILPKTSACIILGSLALAGMPFLAGFYSKDLMLEISLTSLSNFFSILLSFIATLLTAVYSLRIIIFCFYSIPLFKPLSPTKEEDNNLTSSLNRLAMGTMLSGWMMTTFVMFKTPITMQMMLKSLAFFLTLSAMLYSTLIIKNLTTIILLSYPSAVKKFTTLQWFYQKISHSLFSSMTLISSLTLSTRKIDQGWSEKMGAQGMSLTSASLSKTYQHTQTGYIKHYLVMSTITILTVLMTSWVYST